MKLTGFDDGLRGKYCPRWVPAPICRTRRLIVLQADQEECLILLMYCAMMLNFGLPTPNYLDFSLAHAVKLAEGGQNFRSRRMGMLTKPFAVRNVPKCSHSHIGRLSILHPAHAPKPRAEPPPSEHNPKSINSIPFVECFGFNRYILQDLETHDEPRMAVALDFLVQSPNIDVIPAVQSRLRSLLSHRS